MLRLYAGTLLPNARTFSWRSLSLTPIEGFSKRKPVVVRTSAQPLSWSWVASPSALLSLQMAGVPGAGNRRAPAGLRSALHTMRRYYSSKGKRMRLALPICARSAGLRGNGLVPLKGRPAVSIVRASIRATAVCTGCCVRAPSVLSLTEAVIVSQWAMVAVPAAIAPRSSAHSSLTSKLTCNDQSSRHFGLRFSKQFKPSPMRAVERAPV